MTETPPKMIVKEGFEHFVPDHSTCYLENGIYDIKNSLLGDSRTEYRLKPWQRCNYLGGGFVSVEGLPSIWQWIRWRMGIL